jgi:ADP-glucose pyrophosphorylase
MIDETSEVSEAQLQDFAVLGPNSRINKDAILESVIVGDNVTIATPTKFKRQMVLKSL